MRILDKQKFLLFHTLFYDFCNCCVVNETIIVIVEYLNIHYDLLQLFSLKVQDTDDTLEAKLLDEDCAEHLYHTLLFTFEQADDIWDMLVKEDDDDQNDRSVRHIRMDDEAGYQQSKYTRK